MIRPTLLERFFRARINLRILGCYIGTGHHFAYGRNHDTDDELSSDDESPSS